MSKETTHPAVFIHPNWSRRRAPPNGTSVTVKLEFDDEPAIEESWLWEEGRAAPHLSEFAEEGLVTQKEATAILLHDAIDSERLTLRVGRSDSMHLNLLAARSELNFFRAECHTMDEFSATSEQ